MTCDEFWPHKAKFEHPHTAEPHIRDANDSGWRLGPRNARFYRPWSTVGRAYVR
jgi:hypothetical protein